MLIPKLNRISTRATLITGFGLVILLLLGTVAISVTRLNTLGGSVDRMAELRIPKMIAVDQGVQSLMLVSRQMRNVLILDSEAQIRTELGDIQSNSQKMNEIFSLMEDHQQDDVERNLFKDMQAKRAAYQPLEKRFVELAMAGDFSTAKDLMLDKVQAAQSAYVDAISLLSEHLASESQSESSQARASIASSQWMLGGFALFAIVLAVLATLLIVRNLMARLGGEPAYAAEVAARVASGDLVSDVDIRGAADASLLANMKRMRDDLAGAVAVIRQAAVSVADETRQIADGNTELSSRTEEQASSLEETASSMEQLMTAVKLNADGARHASDLATAAAGVAKRGGHTMDAVISTMDDIASSSRKIATIIGVIDSIAFQTNILALNAAVEAARAGEQGRGFAVVAAEVRSLAQRSAAAAKEIKDLIRTSAERVEGGTKLVQDAGHTMNAIIDSVRGVSDTIDQIASSSREQSSAISQVTSAVNQMEQVTQQNAALVEESAAAAESMANSAHELVTAVSRFRVAGATVDNASDAPVAAQPVRRLGRFSKSLIRHGDAPSKLMKQDRM